MLARVDGEAEPIPGSGGLGVSFRNSAGLALAGELLVPEGPGPHPAIVIVCGTRLRDCPAGRALARVLGDQGLAVFLFDCTGCGDSEGQPEQCTAEQQVEDVACALGALSAFDEVDATRIALAGIGPAGKAALTIAARGAAVRAVALFSAGEPPVAVGMPPVEVQVLRVEDQQDAPRAAAWLRARLA